MPDKFIMYPVESSNLAAIGYDAATKEMRVRFYSGVVYAHYDVEPGAHAEFMAAESKGASLCGTLQSQGLVAEARRRS